MILENKNNLSKINRLEEELKTVTADKEAKVDSLNLKVKILSEKLNAQTTMLKSKDDKLKANAATKKQNDILINDLNTKVKELENVEKKDDDKETPNPKVQELQTQLVCKDSRIEKLNLKIWDLEKMDVKIKEQNALIKSQKAEIDELKSDLVCDKCDFKPRSVSGLVMHLMMEHQTKNKKGVFCKDCDFTCEKEFDLKLHISVKHPEKPTEIDFTKIKFMKTNLLTKLTYSNEF